MALSALKYANNSNKHVTNRTHMPQPSDSWRVNLDYEYTKKKFKNI